jgi:hypothetical protein
MINRLLVRCHLDAKAFGEVETRLLEVNEVIKKLDESIRAAAFDFLKPYIAGGNIVVPKDKHGKHDDPALGGSGGTDNLATLIEKHASNKPSHNAKLLSAYWYSQYGSAPFTIKWIEDSATSAGLTIPESVGMTFRGAQAKGKPVYEPLGEKGLIKPTITGEGYLKQIFGVKKGTKTPSTSAATE